MKKKRSKDVQRHWDRVAGLGCIITKTPEATIHHCHSGSMSDIGVNRGMGQKSSDWLVIPLSWDLHVGNDGIDSGVGVRTWESRFGTQVHYLDMVSVILNVNVWIHAGIKRDIFGYISSEEKMTWLDIL